VLRHYVRPELNAEEPEIAEREALALHAARRAGVPTPALPATDPTGSEAGVPAVLMTRLPGKVDWRRSTVSGVVDWLGASTGPAAADVAHCG
jgi:aminoglycoside phosphotransferase (APT) family kinase protein